MKAIFIVNKLDNAVNINVSYCEEKSKKILLTVIRKLLSICLSLSFRDVCLKMPRLPDSRRRNLRVLRI